MCKKINVHIRKLAKQDVKYTKRTINIITANIANAVFGLTVWELLK